MVITHMAKREEGEKRDEKGEEEEEEKEEEKEGEEEDGEEEEEAGDEDQEPFKSRQTREMPILTRCTDATFTLDTFGYTRFRQV